MIAVLLDDPRYPAGPATVVAHPIDVHVYIALAFGEKDGARQPRLRLWSGAAPIGARVKLP